MKHFLVLVFLISTASQVWGVSTLFTGNKKNVTSGFEHEFGLVAHIVPLIVNPTENLEPPTFAAAVFNKGVLAGAGAVIAKHYVLTLCSLLHIEGGTVTESPEHIKVSHPVFYERTLKSIQNVTASSIEPHPDCGGETINVGKNIALIRTKEPMDHVKYPKLPNAHIPEDKGKYMISNFRVLNHAASDTITAIWYIITRKVENNVCEVLFKADHEKFDAKENICMSYFHLGDASYCKGDFGSPLSIRYQNEDTLEGLNIHKHKCGQPREAASFVSVKSNVEWVEKIMKK